MFIIPKGFTFMALWDNEPCEVTAEEDMVAMHKGYLLKLQAEANAEAVK